MATVPAKSQPLHNFTLPHLKWNKDGSSSGGHQRRRSAKSPSRRPNISAASPVRQSPLRDSVSATPPRHQSPLLESAAVTSPRESPVLGDYFRKQSPTPGESSKPYLTSEWVKHQQSGGDPVRHLPRHDLASESEVLAKGKGALVEHKRHQSKNLTTDGMRDRLYLTSSERPSQKSEGRSKAREADVAGSKKSKFLIKIPCKNNKSEDCRQEEPPKADNKDEDDAAGAQEEVKINNNNTDEETKTWNLRPRKPIHKSLNVNGGTVKNNGLAMPEKSKARSQSPSRILNNRSGENDGNCGGNGGKKEKRKLTIAVSLTKEEIEEDIFALTGSKPARRPKKRPKNVQKTLDSVFPGLWLVSITADSYKVSESSLKV